MSLKAVYTTNCLVKIPPHRFPLLVKKLHPNAILPIYATSGSSGADLHAYFDNDSQKTIAPSQSLLVKTGLSVDMSTIKINNDFDVEAQIRSRSGLALKNGIIVLNAPGTIDRDYIGEIGVILYNSSNTEFTVTHGMRIAQIVFCPIIKCGFKESNEALSDTGRGEGGFGSTGL